MAGYTNSAGNSSAVNQLGQFRYFSSSMDKLGTYKATNINIPIPNAHTPQQINWAATTANTLVKSMGVYESYRDQQYKKAEEYLNTHSIDDYKKAITDGEVPFQYDFLAMTKLKEGYGKIVSSLATQDFKNKVDRNFFHGKSPEEVDAAFYQQLQDSIKEFDDGTLGFSTDDYYFNRGVYEKADKTRMGMLVEHAKVEDDYLQQQFEQQQIAQIKDLANDPNKSPDDLIAGVKDILSTTYRSSPTAQYKYIQTLLDEVANNPNGVYILKAIGDIEVSKGVTLREYMGEDAYQEALIKGNSFRFKHDAAYRVRVQQKIDGFVRAGNVRAIQAALAEHIKANGNVQDAEYEYMLRAVNQAYAVQKSLAKKASVDGAKDKAAELFKQFFRAVAAKRKDVPTIEAFEQQLGELIPKGTYTTKDVKVWAQDVVTEIVKSGDKNMISDLLSACSLDNSSTAYMRQYLGNSIEGLFSVVQDASYKVGQTGVALTEDEQKNVNQSINTILSLYNTNSYAFAESLSSTNAETLNNIRVLGMGMSLGKDPIKMVSQMNWAQQIMNDEKAEKSGYAGAIARYRLNTSKVNAIVKTTNLAQRVKYNDFLTAEIKVRAAELLAADPEIKAEDAIKTSEAQVLNEYSAVGDSGAIIPKPLLKQYSSDPLMKTYSDDQYMSVVDEAFNNIVMKDGTGIKGNKDISGSYLSTDSSGKHVIVVCDYLGRERGRIPLSKLADETDKIVKSGLPKAIKEGNADTEFLMNWLINPVAPNGMSTVQYMYDMKEGKIKKL